MKILIVNASFYPVVNGPVIYFDNVSRVLAEEGHEVTLVSSRDVEKVENFGGVHVVSYEKPSEDLSPKEKYDYYRKNSIRKIKGLVEDFEVIISGSNVFLDDLKNHFPNKRIIWRVPSLRNISENCGNDPKEIKRIKEEMVEQIKGVGLAVVSNSLKRQFKNHFNRIEDIEIISSGVDFENFGVSNLESGNVLFVGRLSREKNLKSLLSAFEQTQNGKLIIVGDGPLFRELEDYASSLNKSDKIEFVGKELKTQRYYSEASLFVLPSNYDAFPLVLIEAMAAGLPCIAFKPDDKKIITGADELIKERINGFLVRDEKEMAKKIDLLLSDEKLRVKMGIAARKTVEERPWKRTAEELLKFAKPKKKDFLSGG